MLLKPPDPGYPLMANLRICSATQRIMVRLPDYHERFRQICRDLRYTWDSVQRHWVRDIHPEFHGSMEDRSVELACTLLQERFILDVPDDLVERIQAGAFAPEQRFWVKKQTSGLYQNWFVLDWPRDAANNEIIYRRSRRIAGSRYIRPFVVVPAESFAEVHDFAEAFGFQLSAGAQALISEAEERYAHAVLVVPPPRRASRSVSVPHASAGEIDPELRDDMDDDNEPLSPSDRSG